MKPLPHYWILLAGLMLFILAGCSNNLNTPAVAVESYYVALANKDQDALVNVSCAAWEEDALLELDSLVGVTAKVNELTCQDSGQEGEESLVSCTGGLELDYNGELQSLDLSGRIVITRFEAGEWRVCGYK